MLNIFKYLMAKFLKKARLAAIQKSFVHPSSKLESGTFFFESTMDRHSFCGYDCEVHHAHIGAFTSIANGVVIGGARHPMEWVSMSPVFYAGRDSVKTKFAEHILPGPKGVVIGSDVWVGRSAIILDGVAIGHGAVVGAGAVVVKDVPAYSIVAGNPARLIRLRFEEPVIEALLASEWWSFSDERLRDLGSTFNDVDTFIGALTPRSPNGKEVV
ncbi:CatB-related O-acetyltransferase [Stutzerimonas kunmingensis]|uniref:CatB-related O-acetyltransferase n=1 Tax=Stutzerimonas kunmingensis TaxID=1211807 RepID=UPI00241F8352|nr:CatB-related O-acetyltransferase [Stutzerimonas kunmingensis]